jgi:hypothetical protein
MEKFITKKTIKEERRRQEDRRQESEVRMKSRNDFLFALLAAVHVIHRKLAWRRRALLF